MIAHYRITSGAITALHTTWVSAKSNQPTMHACIMIFLQGAADTSHQHLSNNCKEVIVCISSDIMKLGEGKIYEFD
jgi:hypothetical protein